MTDSAVWLQSHREKSQPFPSIYNPQSWKMLKYIIFATHYYGSLAAGTSAFLFVSNTSVVADKLRKMHDCVTRPSMATSGPRWWSPSKSLQLMVRTGTFTGSLLRLCLSSWQCYFPHCGIRCTWSFLASSPSRGTTPGREVNVWNGRRSTIWCQCNSSYACPSTSTLVVLVFRKRRGI